VSFSGDSFSVVSGSDDCTIRIWSVDGNHLNPKGMAASPIVAACDKKPPKAKGLLAVIGQAVRTLRFMPKDNDRIAAGLENGEIQFWNVRTRQKEYTLRDPNDMTSDRVFSLVFTENSLNLFSAHGSGKVRLWKRPGPGTNFESNPQVIDLGKDIKYPIQALALSEDETILVTVGDFKRVILMNPTSPETTLRQLSAPELTGGDGDFVWNAAFAPGSHILATSDSDGFISIWDLDQCTIVNNSTPAQQDSSTPTLTPQQNSASSTSQITDTSTTENKFIQQQCKLRDRWRASQISVRGLDFYLDGSKLVTAGDDGKIIVWPLTSDKTLDRAAGANGQAIYRDSTKINTLDLTKDVQGTMVVDGDDDFQVQLHRLPQ
jgi:WD40 repeat protein